MKVYALVGKSGTGKSHHSMWVAKEHHINYIIDDGLLISDNRIIAGKSAKREPTKVASVRCAVFSDPAHAARVKAALAEHHVEALLIIGTSDKMVSRIAEALDVGPIEKIIRIEEVATPDEMAIAAQMRNKEGKHVIPAPTFEVKKQFSGYFIDPMVQFFKKKDQTIVEEKTVIRPTYSYLGDYKIAAKAIADICTYDIMQVPSVYKILRIRSTSTKGNRLILDIDLSLNYPVNVTEAASDIAARVQAAIEDMTSINVKAVNINVKTLHLSEQPDRKKDI